MLIAQAARGRPTARRALSASGTRKSRTRCANSVSTPAATQPASAMPSTAPHGPPPLAPTVAATAMAATSETARRGSTALAPARFQAMSGPTAIISRRGIIRSTKVDSKKGGPTETFWSAMASRISG